MVEMTIGFLLKCRLLTCSTTVEAASRAIARRASVIVSGVWVVLVASTIARAASTTATAVAARLVDVAWATLIATTSVATTVVASVMASAATTTDLWHELVESLLTDRYIEDRIFNLDIGPIFGYIERRTLALTMREPLHILLKCPLATARVEVLLGKVAYFAPCLAIGFEVEIGAILLDIITIIDSNRCQSA